MSVGVSKYSDRHFRDLPGAAPDARRFADAMKVWGVAAQRLTLLLDEDATRAAILKNLHSMVVGENVRAPTIVFYFAGHATRERCNVSPRSTLLPADALPAVPGGTGLAMSELVRSLRNLQAASAFIFVDACHCRLDGLSNPLGGADQDAFDASSAGTFFAALAAGDRPALETTDVGGGLFTHRLLSALDRCNTNTPTAAQLSVELLDSARSHGTVQPDLYLLGNTTGWWIDRVPPLHVHRSESTAERSNAVAAVHSALLESRRIPVCIYGEAGLGKSMILQQLVARSKQAVYASVAHDCRTVTEALEHFTAQVADQLPAVFIDGRPSDGPPKLTLQQVEQSAPGVLIVLDHLDRLAPKLLARFAEELSGYNFDLVLGSRSLPVGAEIRAVECPRLGLEEVPLVIEHIKPNLGPDAIRDARLHAISQGNALRLRQAVYEQLDESGEFRLPARLNDIMRLLQVCGGFVSTSQFTKHFCISRSAIEELQNLGALRFSDYEHAYLLHDSFASAENTEVDTRLVTFLAEQSLRFPTHLWAARTLIRCCLVRTFDPAHDQGLVVAFRRIIDAREWGLIEKWCDHIALRGTGVNETDVLAALAMVRIANLDIGKRVVGRLVHQPAKPEVRARLLLLQGEIAWWEGQWGYCVDLSAKALRLCDSVEIKSWAWLNKGMADFFSGDWTECDRTLRKCIQLDKPPRRDLGWAYLILGTSVGIPGTDVDQAEEYIERGIELLRVEGDANGVAIGHNNLAEIQWKSGRLVAARDRLLVAKGLAEQAGNCGFEQEAVRNLIHVYLRLNGPESPEVEERLRTAEQYLASAGVASVESMQMLNTLGTVYAYRRNVDRAREYVSQVTPLTEDNPEYHIYTLANMALIEALDGRRNRASELLNDAIGLAARGRNWLAMEQVRYDWSRIQPPIKENQMSSSSVSIRVIDEQAAFSAGLVPILVSDLEAAGLKVDEEPPNEGVTERMDAFEFVVALASTGAGFQLARAVRSFVEMRKTTIRLSKPDGTELDIDSQGPGEGEIHEYLASLTGNEQ